LFWVTVALRLDRHATLNRKLAFRRGECDESCSRHLPKSRRSRDSDEAKNSLSILTFKTSPLSNFAKIFGPEKPSRTTLQIRFLSIPIRIDVKIPIPVLIRNTFAQMSRCVCRHVAPCSLFQYCFREDLFRDRCGEGYTSLHSYTEARISESCPHPVCSNSRPLVI
jgi:hypothetical protein